MRASVIIFEGMQRMMGVAVIGISGLWIGAQAEEEVFRMAKFEGLRFLEEAFPWIPLMCSMAWMLSFEEFGLSESGLAAMVYSLWAVLLSSVDILCLLLPDFLNLSLLAWGLFFNHAQTFVSFDDALLGAGLGYLIFWLLRRGFQLLRRKEGLGQGDVKLFSALGAWFGWGALPEMMVVSSVLAGLLAIAWHVFRRKSWKAEFPFGPALLLSGGVELFLR